MSLWLFTPFWLAQVTLKNYMSKPVSGSMLKSWDPRPCKEYWIQALRPTSASVAPTLNSRLLTGRSSGIEAVYTACRKMYTHTCVRERKPVIGMEWYYEIYYDILATFTISSVKNKFNRPLARTFLTVINHGVFGCTCPSKSGTCLFFPLTCSQMGLLSLVSTTDTSTVA